VSTERLTPSYVALLTAGDRATEHHFSAHFGRILRAIVRSRAPGRPPSFVEDVVQETFSRTFAALRGHQLRDQERFSSFVIGVCGKVLLELSRQGSRERLDEDGPEQLAPDNPESAAAAREGLRVVREAMDQMGPRDREILQALVVLERDKDALCRQYGVNREHLRVLFHRAKERFRQLYDRRSGEGESVRNGTVTTAPRDAPTKGS
jgi:RNA polymerase sigma-70 factor (ECF subfamily)